MNSYSLLDRPEKSCVIQNRYWWSSFTCPQSCPLWNLSMLMMDIPTWHTGALSLPELLQCCEALQPHHQWKIFHTSVSRNRSTLPHPIKILFFITLFRHNLINFLKSFYCNHNTSYSHHIYNPTNTEYDKISITMKLI